MKSSRHFIFPKSRPLAADRLSEVYQVLYKAFGHQHWWPGETPFEIMVGAILTQNTSWANVEKAIRNLKRAGKLSPSAIHKLSTRALAGLIRPSGYFNIKAVRLKKFIEFLFKRFGGKVDRMLLVDPVSLREDLLRVPGIGPETADSILLYALRKPFFVIDAYTKRIFARHRLRFTKRPLSPTRLLDLSYSDWQIIFTRHLPLDISLYNDFHAQIVHLGKTFCRASTPVCSSCPLSKYL